MQPAASIEKVVCVTSVLSKTPKLTLGQLALPFVTPERNQQTDNRDNDHQFDQGKPGLRAQMRRHMADIVAE